MPSTISPQKPLLPSNISTNVATVTTARNSALFQSSRGLSTGQGSSIRTNIREKLSKISNVASMLCVIDCTVLPIVTVLLPLIGLGASSAQAKWLHEIGHSIAIYFVLPVGGLAATMNYLSSKSRLFASIAAIGLSMIYAANGHGGPILSMLPHKLAHSLHCGTLLHKTVNIIGCACLLSSNYFAHKLGCCEKDQKNEFFSWDGKKNNNNNRKQSIGALKRELFKQTIIHKITPDRTNNDDLNPDFYGLK